MTVLSLAHICLLPMSPPKVVKIAAQAGFGAVGLRVERAVPEDVQFPIRSGTPMMLETRQLLADNGLSVLDAEVFRLVSGQSFDRYRPSLEACAELGAANLLTTCNIKDHSEAVALLSEASEIAASYGLTLNIEFMTWQAINDLKAATRLVEAVDRKNVVFLVDTLHVHRSKVSVEELAAADPSRMRYLQICDAPTPPADMDTMLFQARYERLMPGDGIIPLESYLGALPKSLPVSAEVPMRGRLANIGALGLAREAYAKTRTILDNAGW